MPPKNNTDAKILRRARHALVLRSSIDRDPEIREPGPASPVDQDVRRLQITVDEPCVVDGRKSEADLPRNVGGLLTGKAPRPSEQRRQVGTVDELHAKKRERPVGRLRADEVKHAADIRMRDLSRRGDFGSEHGEPRAIGRQFGRKELERDRLTQLEIVGSVDLAHPAAPQRNQEAIPIE